MGNWLKSGLFTNKARGNKGELELAPLPKYKSYVALLSQSGTDAPVATVLENTLGDIVWTRYDVGVYIATLNNAFYDYTTILYGSLSNISGKIRTFVNDSNSVWVEVTTADETPIDSYLSNTTIEIRVYN